MSAPSYSAVHARVKRLHGSPSGHLCIGCLGPASQWAYIGDESDPQRLTEAKGLVDSRYPNWSKTSIRVYSTDLDLYQPMCSACHGRLDHLKPCEHDESDFEYFDSPTSRYGGSKRQRRCRPCKAKYNREWARRRKGGEVA